MNRAAPVLQVFAREPLAGSVKTRLARSIGADAAAAAYRELTTLTLRHARAARDSGVLAAVEIWCSPTPDSTWFRACAQTTGATLHSQVGPELGSRMAHALTAGLARAPAVLLVGTDCPLLDAPTIGTAAAVLATHDAVVGPAEDGGFVLVGARVALRFDGVRLGTRHALRDTLTGFDRAGIRCASLPVSWDVDDAEDYARWKRIGAATRTTPA